MNGKDCRRNLCGLIWRFIPEFVVTFSVSNKMSVKIVDVSAEIRKKTFQNHVMKLYKLTSVQYMDL